MKYLEFYYDRSIYIPEIDCWSSWTSPAKYENPDELKEQIEYDRECCHEKWINVIDFKIKINDTVIIFSEGFAEINIEVNEYERFKVARFKCEMYQITEFLNFINDYLER